MRKCWHLTILSLEHRPLEPVLRTSPPSHIVSCSKNPKLRKILNQRTKRKKKNKAGWWRTPLIPALGRQRQEDLCEFEASLVYRVSSRTARATTGKACLGRVGKETQKGN